MARYRPLRGERLTSKLFAPTRHRAGVKARPSVRGTHPRQATRARKPWRSIISITFVSGSSRMGSGQAHHHAAILMVPASVGRATNGGIGYAPV